MSESQPLITVVTATYNRSNVLRYALQSVQQSTYPNWELRVVGDACTDDSAEVVQSFNDPHIHWHNLAENSRDQSGPNNVGCQFAQGDYIAYINHDDLWFPDHLQLLFKGMQESKAHMVFSLTDYVYPDGDRHLIGALPGKAYQGYHFVPASSWLVQKSLLQKLGGWRSHNALYMVPSQDVLHRAWKAGKPAQLVPKLTVMAFGTNSREDCYAKRDDHEQRELFAQMQADSEALRVRELTALALAGATDYNSLSVRRPLSHSLRNVLRRACVLFAINPSSLSNWWRFRRKGGFVSYLRKHRGLQCSLSWGQCEYKVGRLSSATLSVVHRESATFNYDEWVFSVLWMGDEFFLFHNKTVLSS